MSDISAKRREVSRRVQEACGAAAICSRCGATWETYADKCSADLADRCPGFQHIDAVQVPIEREVFGYDA